MENDKASKLKLMRFWIFGTFLIIWASLTAFLGIFTSRNWLAALKVGYPIWGLVLVLCVIWYVGYRWWLHRQ